MTTYTKISKDATPTISVDVTRKLSKVNPLIYGGFTEHMGRCIYGGIYDPGNPLSDADGYRLDVLKALKELKPPVIRYPGGNFVATYHWLDGVGPPSERPSRPELAWIGTETNQFGTHEFLKWCEMLGTEPYICLNFGTGTLDEALGWLEYCNGTKNTYYANLRRKNGREQPWNVKYWALGNEVWGPWQVGQLSKEDYAKQAIQWAKALKLLDPTITLILCGQNGISSWDSYVLLEAISFVDMHSIHTYTFNKDHLPNATAPLAVERAIEITASMIDLARAVNKVPSTVPKQTICFDEWNVWSPERAPGPEGAEQSYTLSDALAVGVWLNVFIRQSKYLGMANIAQSVNVISPLMTTPQGIWKQTSYWPLFLFSKYMRGSTLGLHVRCGSWEQGLPLDESLWEPFMLGGPRKEVPWLDVSGVLDDEGWVNLVVINVNEEQDFEVEVKGVGAPVEIFFVGGENVGVANAFGKEVVGIKESKWDGRGKYNFSKHSLTLLRWRSN